MQQQQFKIGFDLPFVFTRYLHGEKDPKTDDQKKALAVKRVTQNGNGIFMPAQMIKALIVQAGSRSGFKFRQFTRGTSIQMLKMSVYVQPNELVLTRDGKSLTQDDIRLFPVDMRLDKNKGMARLWYACVDPPAETEFTISYLDDLDPKDLSGLLDFGGLWCRAGGLRTHDYGMFKVLD